MAEILYLTEEVRQKLLTVRSMRVMDKALTKLDPNRGKAYAEEAAQKLAEALQMAKENAQ